MRLLCLHIRLFPTSLPLTSLPLTIRPPSTAFTCLARAPRMQYSPDGRIDGHINTTGILGKGVVGTWMSLNPLQGQWRSRMRLIPTPRVTQGRGPR